MLAETHDFGLYAEPVARRPNQTQITQADIRAVRLDDKPRHTGHRTDALHGRQMANLRPENVDHGGNVGHRI